MIDFGVNQQIIVNRTPYFFEEHPSAPGIIFAIEGRKGRVYRLRSRFGKYYALKVFKPLYRMEYIKTISDFLQQLRGLPGLEICDRFVISNENSYELVTKYPDLQYAVLMPWLNGIEWGGWILDRKLLNTNIAMRLVAKFIQVLCELEKRELAHTDISSFNVILNTDENKVSLVGLENIYTSAIPTPKYISLGTSSYAHPYALSFQRGQWAPTGDRFSGAILICELMGWSSEKIRAISNNESYFEYSELGKEGIRYNELISVLNTFSPEFSRLFNIAWFSQSLEECPAMAAWDHAIRIDYPQL